MRLAQTLTENTQTGSKSEFLLQCPLVEKNKLELLSAETVRSPVAEGIHF